MAYTTFIPSEFRVVIDKDACIQCGRCAQQCGWNVYTFDEVERRPIPDHNKCGACHRCVTFCPAGAISIKKNELAFKHSDSMSPDLIKAIWRQAETGGIQLTGMGNDRPYLRIFDHLLLDACQVTNPSIDPLREPMEMRTFLGRKPDFLSVDMGPAPAEASRHTGTSRVQAGNPRLLTELDRQLRLETPIMFGGMSYGSVSLNVHRALALAATELGTFMNTGEGGLHADLEPYQDNIIVQCASGRFGVDSSYLQAGAAVEIKIGQGAKPGIGGHLPGEKIDYEVSITRMIPQGTDALSPAPHHDIYSIEDLR
jgi:glutamate synthase domain-containing protein 2